MLFVLLGPVTAHEKGMDLSLGGPQRQALAAFLLLRQGRPAPADSLVEALWADTPPPGAAATLRSHISLLRRQIGRERLFAGPNGYILKLADDDELDADAFRGDVALARTAMTAGDGATARAATSRALGRWRGTPLAGLDDRTWARDAASVLLELRASAVELDIEARLATGAAEEAAALAEEAVAAEPLRERRWGQLMLALYRCRRQAEALSAYQRLRKLLVEELGIEPTAELRDLESRILAQDPQLTEAPPTSSSRVSPVLPGPLPGRLAERGLLPLVARDQQLDVIADGLKAAATSGTCRLIVVSGEPGIGKTRLSREAALRASDSGALVLYGRCDDELRIPYQPWVEIVSYLSSHLSPQMLATASPALAGLSPVVGRPVGTTPSPGPDGLAQQAALFAAVAELLGDISATDPVLLVVDDLQWADRSSLLMLRHLLTVPQSLRMLVIATYRDTEVTSAHPLAAHLADLHRHSGVTRMPLAELDIDEVVELLARASGQEVSDTGLRLAGRLHQETGGNPFFTQEILQHLDETGAAWQDLLGRWQLAEHLDLPTSVQEVVDLRVRHLGDEADRALRLAAIIGREFDLPLLARLAERDEESLLDLLERAAAAGIVTEVADTPDQFRFRHDLIQSTLYTRTSATRRGRTHRRVAEALEALTLGRPGERAGALAQHWLAAHPPDAARALEHCLVAGDHARARLNPEEALRWYDQAKRLLGLSGVDGEIGARLLVGLGDAQRQVGDVSHRETLLRAARLASVAGRSDLLVAAALANTRGGGPARSGAVDIERLQVIDTALAAIGDEDSPDRAVLLSLRAVESSTDHAAWTAYASRALGVAERLNIPAVTLTVLNRSWRHVPDTLPERLVQTIQAIALAEAVGNPVDLFWALQARAVACMQSGNLAEAAERTEQLMAIAERVGQAYMGWMAPLMAAALALFAGQEERAEHLAQVALDRGGASGQPEALLSYAAQLAQIRMHQGRLAEIAPLFQAALDQYDYMPGVHCGLSRMFCELDRLDDARAALAPVAGHIVEAIPHDDAWLIAMCNAAEAVARLHYVDDAAAIWTSLAPWGDQVCFTAARGEGAVAHQLGLLAAVLGKDADAEACFQQAAAIHSRMGAPYFLARTSLEHGLWLQPRVTPDAAERGKRLVSEAQVIAQLHRYEGILRRTARTSTAI